MKVEELLPLLTVLVKPSSILALATPPENTAWTAPPLTVLLVAVPPVRTYSVTPEVTASC